MLYLQEMAERQAHGGIDAGSALDSPRFSPDGQTSPSAARTEEGTDLYTINVKNTVAYALDRGAFQTTLSPTFSPDGQRMAFVSTRPGLPQIYVMAADGTDQQLFHHSTMV